MTTTTRNWIGQFPQPKEAVAAINIETPEEMKFAAEMLAEMGIRASKSGRMGLSNTFEGVVWVTQDEENRYFSETHFSAVQGIIDTVHAMSNEFEGSEVDSH
jgi:hypothetical protein